MATTRKPKTSEEPIPETVDSAIKSGGLAAKLFQLRIRMSRYRWEKDGVNRHQQYKYISEAQYKKNFQTALIECGLDFKLDATGYEMFPAISDKMHLIVVTYTAQISDPETGEYREFELIGAGADNGDKAVYKAETGAIKYFLAGNFLVAEDLDPESDEQETKKEKPAFKTPEQKTEIKKQMTSQSAPATDEQIEIIQAGVEQLLEVGKEDEATAFAEAASASDLTKADAEEIIEAIGGLLDD